MLKDFIKVRMIGSYVPMSDAFSVALADWQEGVAYLAASEDEEKEIERLAIAEHEIAECYCEPAGRSTVYNSDELYNVTRVESVIPFTITNPERAETVEREFDACHSPAAAEAIALDELESRLAEHHRRSMRRGV